MVLREVLSGLPMSALFPFAIAFLPNIAYQEVPLHFQRPIKSNFKWLAEIWFAWGRKPLQNDIIVGN